MTRLTKKLQPAKKALKSFSNTLKSKFHKLNIPKAIKTTPQRLISTFNSLIHFIPASYRRNRSLTSSTKPYYYSTTSYHHIQRKKNNNKSIDIITNNNHHQSQGETNRRSNNKGVVVHGNMDNNLHDRGQQIPTFQSSTTSSSGMDTIEDAWKALVDKSPHLSVDEKAEEFIYKFREEMRLQKERSLLEFHEMLARGT